jgi:hypothetical protein
MCWVNSPASSESDEAGQFVGKRAGSAAVLGDGSSKATQEPRQRPPVIGSIANSSLTLQPH